MKQINKLFTNKNVAAVLYLMVAAGVLLMLFSGNTQVLPEKEEEEPVEETKISTEDTEKRLEELLSLTEGAGNVRVMITYKNNGNIVLAENKANEESREDSSSTYRQESNVVLNGEEQPLILSEGSPEIEGVLIVAEGGENVEVKNGLIRAAEALLGVEPHKIEVLKMKTEG